MLARTDCTTRGGVCVAKHLCVCVVPSFRVPQIGDVARVAQDEKVGAIRDSPISEKHILEC